MPVRVIAGLGNPGASYDGTRHNVGFRILDALAASCGATWKREARYCAHTANVVIAGQNILLVKPLTYMNNSGRSLGEVCRYLKLQPEDILVVYDEYQVALGRLKLSIGGGPGGHNGIEDVIRRIGDRFIRFRVGIGPREKPPVPLKDFVLGPFAADEETLVQASLNHILDALRLVVDLGPVLAMNRINQRPANPNESDKNP